ncbi:hypothetical protein [Roseomonas gilardii]|uniref:hypothetical protein n=1 Tax=Roseomonas gilardii TaxID=257708 RepID=UPI001F325363|nr:hypothetical protein [Roseomonas gilardii]
MTIFNIDTIRPGVRRAAFDGKAGWLECFVGEGDHWSFVRPADPSNPSEGQAAEVVEKLRISSLCCSGLYHFGSTTHFCSAYAEELAKNSAPTELYIAPIYRHLIKVGHKVHYSTIAREEIFFSGTPAEYEILSTDTSRLLNAW